MKQNVLITVPNPPDRGGVTIFWNSIFSVFESYDDIKFQTFGVGGHGKNLIALLLDQWNYHKALKTDIDLAFLNPSLISRGFFRDGLFAKQLIRAKIPFVVFFHGWELEFEQKVDTKYITFFQNSFAHAKKIFVLSAQFKEKILEWGFQGEVIVQTTAVDASLVKNFSLDKKTADNVTNTVTKILFISRTIKEKGLFELVEAFENLRKKIDDIELIIAGDGGDFDELQKVVSSKENIRLTGHVSGDDKIRLFEESDIYCLPSYTEGLPVAVLEAMLFGLPVITTRVGGLKSFLIDEKMGYFIEPKDVDDIEDKIEMMLSNKEMMTEMGKFNYEYAREHLTNSVIAKGIYNHLKEIM